MALFHSFLWLRNILLPIFLEFSIGSLKYMHEVLIPKDRSFLIFPVYNLSLSLISLCGLIVVAIIIHPFLNLNGLRIVLVHCRYVRPGGGFVPNFQLFEKGDVNGEKEQKVFTFLKVSEHKPGKNWSGR